jgi:hypothetical protein
VFAPRYFGSRYFGAIFWGKGGVPPSVPGIYWSSRYFGSAFWGPRYFPGTASTPTPTTYPDLVAAVVAQLRSWNNGAFATSLGDSTSTPKIWVGAVMGSPALPWARISRPMGLREYFGLGNYIETGQVQVSVFASSYSAARALAWQVSSPNTGAAIAGALDDPALTFTEASLMVFRIRQPVWITDDGVGVGAPKTYHAVLTFDYKINGQIA